MCGVLNPMDFKSNGHPSNDDWNVGGLNYTTRISMLLYVTCIQISVIFQVS
jgi:hypothetical protein